MALAADTYSTVAAVEAEERTYTNDAGAFDTTTFPTLATVETFMDELSVILDVQLANEGFSVPVTDARAVLACNRFVKDQTAKMVRAVNIGRSRGARRINLPQEGTLMERAAEWVQANARGLEAMGAGRSTARRVNVQAVTRVDGWSDDITATEMS